MSGADGLRAAGEQLFVPHDTPEDHQESLPNHDGRRSKMLLVQDPRPDSYAGEISEVANDALLLPFSYLLQLPFL